MSVTAPQHGKLQRKGKEDDLWPLWVSRGVARSPWRSHTYYNNLRCSPFTTWGLNTYLSVFDFEVVEVNLKRNKWQNSFKLLTGLRNIPRDRLSNGCYLSVWFCWFKTLSTSDHQTGTLDQSWNTNLQKEVRFSCRISQPLLTRAAWYSAAVVVVQAAKCYGLDSLLRSTR